MKNARRSAIALGLSACLALALVSCGGDSSDSSGRVSINKNKAVMDHADILNEDTENYVTNLSVALQESCGAQIGVYTVEYLGNSDAEQYAYQVFGEWGLGDAQKNNGILLLLAAGDDDYYVMRGTGIEDQLSVSTLSNTLEQFMEPYWVVGDYDSGTRATVRSLTALLCNIYGLTMDIDAVANGTAVETSEKGGGVSFIRVLLILLAVVLVIWLLLQLTRPRRRRRPPSAPPPVVGPPYGGYAAPRRSGFQEGISRGIGFGIGQNIGRNLFGAGGTRRPPPPPMQPSSRPPQQRPAPPRGGGYAGASGAGRRSGGAARGGVSVSRGGGSFRSGGGSTRGGGAGRRH